MNIKKLGAAVLAAALTLSLGACSGGSGGSGGLTNGGNYILASGGTSGTYYPFGGAIGQLINSHVEGANVTTQATGASKENIRLIASKEADLAIVQNDVLAYSAEGIEIFDGEKVTGVSTVATLYPEIVQIVVAADSSIQSVADLKGKKVSVGDAGSGVEANAKQILEAYGLSFSDINKENLSFKDSGDALKNGQIEAYFVTAGIPNTSIMDVMVQKPVRLLPVDGDVAKTLMEKYSFYTSVNVPADTYNMPADVTTLAVKATLVVRADMTEDEVYNLTAAIFDNLEEFGTAHAKGKEVTLEGAVQGVSVPMHPGAQKYFDEKAAK